MRRRRPKVSEIAVDVTRRAANVACLADGQNVVNPDRRKLLLCQKLFTPPRENNKPQTTNSKQNGHPHTANPMYHSTAAAPAPRPPSCPATPPSSRPPWRPQPPLLRSSAPRPAGRRWLPLLWRLVAPPPFAACGPAAAPTARSRGGPAPRWWPASARACARIGASPARRGGRCCWRARLRAGPRRRRWCRCATRSVRRSPNRRPVRRRPRRSGASSPRPARLWCYVDFFVGGVPPL